MTNFTEWNIMTPDTVVIWTSIYCATSVIWLVISGLLLYESYKCRLTSATLIGWVAVSAGVAAIDFAGTVAFGVDYNRVQSALGNKYFLLQAEVDESLILGPTDFLLAAIFMMIMCARGFILWIMNVGLVIYLGVAASKLHEKGSPNLLEDSEYSSRFPSFSSPPYNSAGASMYDSPKVDTISQGRQNPALKPDPTYGWNTQSPKLGNQQPNQKDFPQTNSFNPHGVVNPIRPIPRAGKPSPIVVDPLPTPQPDYSPPPPRQKHQPNIYEAPPRSVLKQTNAQRQSYF